MDASCLPCCSVTQTCPTLWDPRLPCASPSPSICSNSCPLSQWCHPTISSSVIPFSSCLQSFPASGSFLMGQVFASGGQSVGASASASVFPMNTQDWSPSGWTGWISLQSKGLSRVFSNTTAQEHQFFGIQPSLWSSTYIHGLNSPWGCKGSDTTEPVSLSLLSHPYRTTGKTIALTRWTFVGKVVSAF